MKGKTMMRNLNISMKGALRPLAFALVLCLLVTMTPVGYGGAVFAAEDEQAIAAQDEPMPIADAWDGQTDIPEGITKTVTTSVTVSTSVAVSGTLELAGILKLDGGTIQGNGKIIRTGANGCINVENNSLISTISGITIDGNSRSGYESEYALITMYGANATLNLDGVTITDAAVKESTEDSDASAISVGTEGITIYISGDTKITNNKGKLGAIKLSTDTKIYIKGSVQIYGNSNGSGAESNIALNNANQLYINGALTEEALISLPSTPSGDIVKPDGSSVSSCAEYADRFVADAFDDYGVVASGSNLSLKDKHRINTTANVNDVLEYHDRFGDRLGKTITSALENEKITVKLKDNAVGRYFILDIKVNNGGVIITGSDNEYTFNMPNSVATVNATIQEYITAVKLAEVSAPIHGNSVNDANSALETAVRIEGKTPNDADITVVPETLKWYDSDGNAEASGNFEAGEKYVLKGQLKANNGSTFAQMGNVTVTMGSESCTVISVTDSETLLDFSCEFEAKKMSIGDAISQGKLTVTVVPYNGTYDGKPHSITVSAVDKIIGGEPTVKYSRDENDGFVFDNMDDTVAQKNVTENGAVTVYVKITSDNYSGEYSTRGSITIGKRDITPSVDVSGVVPKIYDGTKTVEGAKLTFDKASESGTTGLVEGESLIENEDYTVSLELESPDAATRKVNATDITLLGTDKAKNYNLTKSEADATALEDLVTKATPEPAGGNVNWGVISISTTLQDILNRLNGGLLDFRGVNDVRVAGKIAFVDSDFNDPLGNLNVPVQKNYEYNWKFTPDTPNDKNYTVATGTATLLSSDPVKTITITGITAPVGGNTTASAIAGGISVSGSAGSSDNLEHDLTVTAIRWTVSDGALGTAGVTDKFWYNRKHTVSIDVEARNGDVITNTAIANISLNGTNPEMTLEWESGTKVTLSYTFGLTEKGTLSADNISAAGISVTYSGVKHTLTAEAVNLQDPAKARIKFDGSDEAPSFTDAISNKTVAVTLEHDDYSGLATTTVTVDIAKLEVGVNIGAIAGNIEERPYDGTTNVALKSGTDLSSLLTLDGKVGDDDVEAKAASVEFTSANVEPNKTVVVKGITLDGDKKDNYILKNEIAENGITTSVGKKITQATPKPQGKDGMDSLTWNKSLNYGEDPKPTLGALNFRVNSEKPFINKEAEANGKTVAVEGNVALKGSLETVIGGNRAYEWEFTPTDRTNYVTATGKSIFLEIDPIKVVTLSGITVTERSEVITKENVSVSEQVANITVKDIKWAEGSASGTQAGTHFRYNKVYYATVTIAIEEGADAVDKIVFAADLEDIRLDGLVKGVDWDLDGKPELNGDRDTATIKMYFKPTGTGTIETEHIQFTAADGLTGSNLDWSGTYSASDKVLTAAAANVNSDYDTIMDGRAVITYSVTTTEDTPADNTFKTAIPQSQLRDAGTYYVHARISHPDYEDPSKVTLRAKVEISKADVTVRFAGGFADRIAEKSYDGLTDAAVTNGSIISDLFTVTGTKGSDNLSVSAWIEFNSANVNEANSIKATGITLTGTSAKNYTITYPVNGELIGGTVSGKIKKATPEGKPSHAAISSSVSLSAIGLVTEGAVFVNRNNESLEVVGTLQLTTEGGTRYLTEEELDAILVVRGLPYAWKFEPNEEHETNYNSVTGSTILWHNPSAPSGGGGGGGGGGTVQSKPSDTDNMVTGTAVVVERVTSGEGSGQGDELSDTIHVYLVKNGRVVETETYTAKLAGEIVRDVLKRNPNANVVVGADGKPIAKAMINGDNILIQAIGSKYLTPEFRRANFTDIDGHWAKQAIEFCAVRELMQGVGNNEFSPNEQVTRSMAVTLFYRLEQEPYSVGVSGFNDIDESWFTDAINWASSNSIVNGFGIYFAPYWSITREQLAVMLYNYSVICLGEERVTDIDLSMYGDVENIGEWAKEAVSFCTAKGLMQGESNTGFYPTRTATRAELAVIMERVVKLALEGAEESVSIGQ